METGEIMNVFLDLEETVIDEFKAFPTFLPGNCEDIRRFLTPLKMIGDPRVGIFSFAIHTKEEEDIFWNSISEQLDKLCDVRTFEVIRVSEMFLASKLLRKIRFEDVTDFIQVIGKAGAFHDWCQLHHPGEFSFLIDDVVPNQTLHDNDNGSLIQTLNIKSLFKPHNNVFSNSTLNTKEV
jgi:hypothetical protein